MNALEDYSIFLYSINKNLNSDNMLNTHNTAEYICFNPLKTQLVRLCIIQLAHSIT